jgi:hypothetical protein
MGYIIPENEMLIDGQPAPANPSDHEAGMNVVTPGYFEVMGIGILRGSAFIPFCFGSC